jgi:hypothetical protein
MKLQRHETAIDLQTSLARLAPGILDRIASDCDLTGETDKLTAIVAFCVSHSITLLDLKVRYPELTCACANGRVHR